MYMYNALFPKPKIINLDFAVENLNLHLSVHSSIEPEASWISFIINTAFFPSSPYSTIICKPSLSIFEYFI